MTDGMGEVRDSAQRPRQAQGQGTGICVAERDISGSSAAAKLMPTSEIGTR